MVERWQGREKAGQATLLYQYQASELIGSPTDPVSVNRQTPTQTHRHGRRQTYTDADTQTRTQTDRHGRRQAGRQKDRQTDRQTVSDRKLCTSTLAPTCTHVRTRPDTRG